MKNTKKQKHREGKRSVGTAGGGGGDEAEGTLCILVMVIK